MKQSKNLTTLVTYVAILGFSFVSGLLLASAAGNDLDLPVVDPKTLPKVADKPIPQPPPPVVPSGVVILDGPVVAPSIVVDPPKDEPLPTLYGEEIPAADSLIYVLDMSGSMNEPVEAWIALAGGHKTGSRAERAMDEFERSVNGLLPSMKFSLIVYSCWIREVPQGLKPATPETKANAVSWLRNTVRAEGGTATSAGVATALQHRSNMNIALMTDGEPGCGFDAEGNLQQRIATHANTIRNNNTQGARIDVFAINPPSHATLDFCRRVANDSGGRCFEIR